MNNRNLPRSTTNALDQTTAKQQTLPFDTGVPTAQRGASAQTRREAYQVAKPKIPGRSLRAMAVLQQAGPTGMIREEIGHELGIVHHAVSSITKPLLTLGLVVETAQRRPTSTGSPAVVLVASQFVETPEVVDDAPA